MKVLPLISACVLAATAAPGHYIPGNEYAITNATPLPVSVETRGRVSAPKAAKPDLGTPVSGQGFWKFTAARDLVPVPAAVTHQQLTNAHGTIIVDKKAGVAYWGLQGVGWIGFSNHLHVSWIIEGNAAFTNGNLHGADILPRWHQSPLIAAADNVSGKIYLTDAHFHDVESLGVPDFEPYVTNKSFRPTDVAFVDEHELWAVDGYARQRFLPIERPPLHWRGDIYGGKAFSATLHGVTYDKPHDDLLFSARPEGALKRVDRHSLRTTEVLGLPAGTLLCDVALWGDYALAACLEGPNKTPGPIHIINLKKRAIVSTIRPKEDLGYTDADHIHDAAWFVTSSGNKREIYILFTNWKPGGIGALKLVNVPD
jgi:hypothetical protein